MARRLRVAGWPALPPAPSITRGNLHVKMPLALPEKDTPRLPSLALVLAVIAVAAMPAVAAFASRLLAVLGEVVARLPSACL